MASGAFIFISKQHRHNNGFQGHWNKLLRWEYLTQYIIDLFKLLQSTVLLMSDVSIPLSQLMRGTSHVDMLCISELCTCMLVTQSCLPLYNPMDCSSPGSSVHGILQARILEQVAISFPRRSFWPRDQTCISCPGRPILYHWATWEAIF